MRCVGCLALATLFASLVQAAKLNSTEKTQIEEPRPADVPSDATLEAQGAIIGAIEFDTRQIFDEHDARENSGLYHLADQLHVRTKESTIRVCSIRRRSRTIPIRFSTPTPPDSILRMPRLRWPGLGYSEAGR
jgi:hypothetical protein